MRHFQPRPFCIGIGKDMHRLDLGRPLVVGGVRIAHEKGAVGHSDADVLVHALCDALLGALGLGDIGQHFPDTDPNYEGINSLLLLDEVYAKVRAAGYVLGNVDAVIELERPKLAPHFPQIKAVLAKHIEADPSYVSLKATTGEGIGIIGRQEAIAAEVVVLLFYQEARSFSS